MDTEDKTVKMRCEIDKGGIVSCNITKETFDELQQENIEPTRVVFEIVNQEPEE